MRYAKPRVYSNLSRYSIYRQIIDSNNDTYLETANQYVIKTSETDVYHEVQPNEENRLDIIAYKYYNNAEYFWVIAMANSIVDPFVIKRGDILRIPALSSLMEWKGPLYGRV